MQSKFYFDRTWTVKKWYFHFHPFPPDLKTTDLQTAVYTILLEIMEF